MFSKNRKYVGYVCFFIGVALVVYGLSIYLDGPKEDGTSTLECIYVHKEYPTEKTEKRFQLFSCGKYPTDNQLYSYTTFATGLVLEREIDLVKTNKSETAYLYLMNSIKETYLLNSTNFTNWFNSIYPLPNKEIIELKDNSSSNFIFKPHDNDSYYALVFTDNANETQDPPINVEELLTIKKLDFNSVWSGIFVALFGGGMILVGFFFGNPVDKIIMRICSITCPLIKSLYPNNYKEYYDLYKRSRLFAWKWLVGIAIVGVFLETGTQLKDIQLNWLPQEIKFLLLDWIIRIMLFIFFINLLLIFIYVIFFEIAQPILDDIFKWLVKKGFGTKLPNIFQYF